MTVQIPKTQEEVFRQYYPHVKFLVARSGIRRDYVEDYSMLLITKFMERDMLNLYDPTHTTEVNGVMRTANFKTFLSGFVSRYLKHFAARDKINASRSAYSSDVRLGENNDTPLLDYLGITVSDDTDTVEVDELIDRVKKSLQDPKKERLSEFFDIILLQVEDYGKVNTRELSEIFEVTRTTVHNWLKKLRTEFEQCQ